MNISFIGLGKLGLPLATLLAKGNELICIDKDKNIINSLIENNFELLIPAYQRGYRWDYKNVTKLLDDIFNAFKKNFSACFDSLFS